MGYRRWGVEGRRHRRHPGDPLPLEQFQSQFVAKDSPGTSDEEHEETGPKTDGLDALNAQDVSYSIRRLIRGLASPRESSRLGFAVALTEVSVDYNLAGKMYL